MNISTAFSLSLVSLPCLSTTTSAAFSSVFSILFNFFAFPVTYKCNVTIIIMIQWFAFYTNLVYFQFLPTLHHRL